MQIMLIVGDEQSQNIYFTATLFRKLASASDHQCVDYARIVAAAHVPARRGQAAKLEQDIFKQRKRLADVERTLQTKTTNSATESQRIATDKVAWAMGKLADIRRTELKGRDSRIYPGWYAPVMVMQNSRREVRPMRYQCRPASKPAIYDTKFPGCYNARSDNLEGFWKEQFGFSHGVMVVNAFFDNVSLHPSQGRELAPGEKNKTSCLSSDQITAKTCWSRAYGRTGRETAKSCFHSPRSPMSRRRRCSRGP